MVQASAKSGRWSHLLAQDSIFRTANISSSALAKPRGRCRGGISSVREYAAGIGSDVVLISSLDTRLCCAAHYFIYQACACYAAGRARAQSDKSYGKTGGGKFAVINHLGAI